MPFNSSPRVCVVIPARFASKRFPGKPLAPLLGKPLILWVAELSSRAVGRQNVYIATEDNRISEVVKSAGFKSILTSNSALTGTDRIAEAIDQIEAEIYINVQGDEPLIDPADIVKVWKAKIARMDAVINAFTWISPEEDPCSINIPKVITTELDRLIYISRISLPGFKDSNCSPLRYKKQVCIYAFTAKELKDFSNYGRKSELECFEDIEILRFLELDKSIYMIEAKSGSLAVDIPEDITRVEAILRKRLIK